MTHGEDVAVLNRVRNQRAVGDQHQFLRDRADRGKEALAARRNGKRSLPDRVGIVDPRLSIAQMTRKRSDSIAKSKIESSLFRCFRR